MANHASRVIVKAYGELDIDAMQSLLIDDHDAPDYHGDSVGIEEAADPRVFQINSQMKENDIFPDISSYLPDVSAEGVWTLNETDLGSVFCPVT